MCASLFYFVEMRKVFPLVKTFLLSSNVILIDIFSQFQVLLRVCWNTERKRLLAGLSSISFPVGIITHNGVNIQQHNTIHSNYFPIQSWKKKKIKALLYNIRDKLYWTIWVEQGLREASWQADFTMMAFILYILVFWCSVFVIYFSEEVVMFPFASHHLHLHLRSGCQYTTPPYPQLRMKI